MSPLADLIPSLQRAVAVPGTFEALFPDTAEDDLLATLLDAFAEAQLDGLLAANTATDLGVVTPDLTRAETALVVLYASVRILVAEIRSRKTHIRYEAAGAVFEQAQSSTMLVEILREQRDRKATLLIELNRLALTSGFVMYDQYLAKAVGGPGFSPDWLGGDAGWSW